MTTPYQKAFRITATTLVVYILLTATHLGEFWPFSIYPMFSRGGHPWVRAVVRELPPDATPPSWQAVTSLSALAGTPYPLGPAGINQNDIANFVSKSSRWDDRRIQGLRKVFGSALADRALLLYRTEGRLRGDSVVVTYQPFLLLAPDTTLFHPSLAHAPLPAP
ncbi:MAG: hypothetical protein KatS3mg042_1719 [Rhodothermaceae bacterium]|nr:MAG: hypothetical protein KatS3mg042_1719 [Rhodothermaceae bacterium]